MTKTINKKTQTFKPIRVKSYARFFELNKNEILLSLMFGTYTILFSFLGLDWAIDYDASYRLFGVTFLIISVFTFCFFLMYLHDVYKCWRCWNA